MLNGCSKNSGVKSCHLWSDILKMNSDRQLLFIQRVLLLHEVASNRGAKSSNARLSLADWNAECDRCCVLGYILETMQAARNDEGNALFPEKLFAAVFQRTLEGTLTNISGESTFLWTLFYYTTKRQ